MGVGRYKQIKRKEGNLIKVTNISAFIPTPTDKDYNRGYMLRYFAQKSNDVNSIIYEIDSKQYTKLQFSDFHIVVSLDWRITGEVNEIKKSNSASVRIASQKIPKLSLYLPNLLQFHKK